MQQANAEKKKKKKTAMSTLNYVFIRKLSGKKKVNLLIKNANIFGCLGGSVG